MNRIQDIAPGRARVPAHGFGRVGRVWERRAGTKVSGMLRFPGMADAKHSFATQVRSRTQFWNEDQSPGQIAAASWFIAREAGLPAQVRSRTQFWNESETCVRGATGAWGHGAICTSGAFSKPATRAGDDSPGRKPGDPRAYPNEASPWNGRQKPTRAPIPSRIDRLEENWS